MTGYVPTILAVLTVFADFLIIILIGIKIIKKDALSKFPLSIIYYLLFAICLTATFGSLFYSEILKYPPCRLCWYQRILMYPQTILIALALIRKEKVLKPYLILLNTVGALLAAYHYFIQRFPGQASLFCSAGSDVPCSQVIHWYFGYISILMMALSAFILNLVLLTTKQENKRTS